jgi:hippurate hydrolase
MASSDYVTINLYGIGGHGAMPHKANDPIVAMSSIVMSLQTIVSRNIDPQEMAVITVGAVYSGQANNVIPASATMELSVRALNPMVRKQLELRIKELVKHQAESYSVQADIEWKPGYAVLVNSPKETDIARKVALQTFGAQAVIEHGAALTASEDFAFMLEKVPGCYFFVGNGAGNSKGACMVHNPQYDFNDANIEVGAKMWKALVEEFLGSDK